MNIENISRYMWIGRRDKYWYRDCKETFIDIFGEKELHLVTRLFAATSINTSLKANLSLFRKSYFEIKNDLPVGNYLPNIKNQITRIRSGGELTGRKINSFARSMAGDQDAVVVDVWLLRAFSMDKKYKRLTGVHEGRFRSGGATDKQYTLIESWVRQEAKYRGLQPCEVGAMIWSGIRIEVNGDTQTRYCDMLRQSLTNLFQVI